MVAGSLHRSDFVAIAPFAFLGLSTGNRQPIRMNPTTFIFDLDGTLIDSLLDLGTTTNAVLEACGFPIHPIDRYRTLVGDGVRVLFQRALPVGVREDESILDSCIAQFHERYEKSWDRTTLPYPGIDAMLDRLVADRHRLAVLSNKPHPFTVACVERFFPSHPWGAVLGSSAELPKKPDPAGVFSIVAELNTVPEKCYYLGDTNTDMWTARAAGCIAVGVTWGFRPAEELLGSGADHIIDHPDELFGILPG
jgi:phosphoglycolate phosphatase